MCIYYKGRNGLTYSSQEHVVPAAIGGLRKLPRDCVSDQFNNDISKLEQDFFRNGLISIPRPIIGPGKRGNLSEKKATKSKVAIIRNVNDIDQIGLGYTSLGVLIEIPHVALNTTTGKFSFNCTPQIDKSAYELIDEFKQKCDKYGTLKTRIITDDNLPADLLLMGIQSGIEGRTDCFIAKNPNNEFPIKAETFETIGRSIASSEFEQKIYMPNVTQQFIYRNDHVRVFGKIAFNFLALVKGKDFVNLPCFDHFRNWIIGRDTFVPVRAIPQGENALSKLNINLPEDAHSIYIVSQKSELFAEISLYNSFSFSMIITDQYDSSHFADGFICDWKNRKEIGWAEFMGIQMANK